MSKHSKNVCKDWKLWILIIAVIGIIAIGILYLENNETKEVNNIKIGDIITLKEKDRILLREKTINNLKNYLKAPSTAQFQEEFIYSSTEPNIIKVKGYVDSQNSFGAMLRADFTCEYFVVENDTITLVYVRYNEEDIFNIKNTYIEEYKKQARLKEIKQTGNQLSQEKLEYIMNEFNNEQWNDVGRITKVQFKENKSFIEVQVTAKTEMDKNYWINFNICSVIEYIKEFDTIGIVEINLTHKDKTVKVSFDSIFIKEKWKDNQQINLVKDLFDENYKEF